MDGATKVVFEVTERCCDECLFTRNRIVRRGRMRELVAQCQEHESYFVCHKSTAVGGNVCCRGFYELNSTVCVRLARMLHVVRFVPVPREPAVERGLEDVLRHVTGERRLEPDEP